MGCLFPGHGTTSDLVLQTPHETDIWVASSSADGMPCLVPLWFLWDGEAIWVSTQVTNPTGRNLRDNGRARLALGDTELAGRHVMRNGDWLVRRRSRVLGSCGSRWGSNSVEPGHSQGSSAGVGAAFAPPRPNDVVVST
ncbi:pyridoxamine 5'-phosphate oxidase family protein [Streptomyces sp. NPDC056638]|uniref:pyridoxamine 5'-phosphate oxidase family protein n=1 Tax=Streptomyces sp. NPDC056638 TaxID=3345887 RepID=UPI00367EF7A0